MRSRNLLLTVFVLVAACSVGPSPSPAPTSSPSPSPPASARATPTFNAPVETVDPSTDGVIDAVIAYAAQLMDRRPEEFDVVRAEHGTWSDSSLGCAFPNEAYDQALTEGYWVVLRVGGILVDYRVATGGEMTICTIPESARRGPIQ